MRCYYLERHEDESGVSGTGTVAEVVEFATGKVAVAFLPGDKGVASVIVYESLADAVKIHGHGGKTELVSGDNSGGFEEALQGLADDFVFRVTQEIEDAAATTGERLLPVLQKTARRMRTLAEGGGRE